MAIATLKTGFVVQGHIYFLHFSVIKIEKVFAVYTDCTLITIKLSLVNDLSKIRRQIIDYCPAVYFISEPTTFFCQLYIHKYDNSYILLLLHLTSEIIDIPLPCNITEYKTLAICHVIFIWASNILWLHMNFIR